FTLTVGDLDSRGHDSVTAELEANPRQWVDGRPAHGLPGAQRVEHAQVAGASDRGLIGGMVEGEVDGLNVAVERDDAVLVGAQPAEPGQVQAADAHAAIDVEAAGDGTRKTYRQGRQGTSTARLRGDVEGDVVPRCCERLERRNIRLGSVGETRR